MPRSSRPTTVFPIVVREVEVLETFDLTPSTQRVVVTGDELREGKLPDAIPRPPFVSLGFDDHVKLVFTGHHSRSWIGTQQAYTFAWNREALTASRDYTVRSYDETANRLVLDVVRHEHGLAADWFAACVPGDVLHIAGPKTSMSLTDGIEQWLLIGDETALPAIARFFDEIDENASVRALIEVPTAADRIPLRDLPSAEVTWLVREGVPAGESDALMRELERLKPPTSRVYAWCAGEALTLTPVRRHLRTVWNLPKEDVEVVGYWRHPTGAAARTKMLADTVAAASSDNSRPREDAERAGIHEAERGGESPEEHLQAMDKLHEMTEMLPPVVTRLAATFDLSAHVASGRTSLKALSLVSELPPAPLETLLDAMTSLGLLTRTGEHYAVTTVGALLAEEDLRDELTLNNPANRLWLDLLTLDDVLRRGLASEHTLAERRRRDRELDESLNSAAQDLLRYLYDPLAEIPALQQARRVLVVGEATEQATRELARRLRQAQVVCGGRTPAGHESMEEVDAIVAIGCFTGLSPRQSTTMAADLVSRASHHVLVVENLRDGAAQDDHLAAADLQALASTGHPLPCTAQLESMLREAGARSAESVHPGWGFGTYNTVVVANV